MEAVDFAPLAATSKNTILRFESGQYMPRPSTVLEIDSVFRKHGIFPTFTREGEPRGLFIGWQAYRYAYPNYEVHHKSVEEIAAHQRKYPPPPGAVRSWKGVDPDAPVPPPVENPVDSGDIARMEAEAARLMAELARLRGEDDEHDF